MLGEHVLDGCEIACGGIGELAGAAAGILIYAMLQVLE